MKSYPWGKCFRELMTDQNSLLRGMFLHALPVQKFWNQNIDFCAFTKSMFVNGSMCRCTLLTFHVSTFLKALYIDFVVRLAQAKFRQNKPMILIEKALVLLCRIMHNRTMMTSKAFHRNHSLWPSHHDRNKFSYQKNVCNKCEPFLEHKY